MNQIEAVIFDLDGTLIDSMGVWERIDGAFLRNRGIEVPSDYGEAIRALGFRQTAQYTIRRFGFSDTEEALMAEWHEMARHEYETRIPLKPYAKEYLRSLQANQVKLGIATAAPPALYEAVLRHHRIRDFFEVICSTDEVGRGKAYPDLFLHTAARLNTAPEHCLVFEDILQAIESARRAGMMVYGIYDDASRKDWEAITRTADGALFDFQDAPLSYNQKYEINTQ
ncbi:MAG: HAD family phosphatase [Treponema sp.]|nr:HAD family phosphatase [Treponema sp.]